MCPPSPMFLLRCARTSRRVEEATCQASAWPSAEKRGNRLGSRLNARLEPRVIALDGDDELDFARALLFLEVIGLLADELLKRFERKPARIFSRLLLRMAEGRIEVFHFLIFVVGVLAGDRKRQWLRGVGRGFRGLLFFPHVLNLARRRAKVPLHAAFFFLFHPLAEDFAILRIHLGQIAVAEALRKIHLRTPVAIALHRDIDAPLELRGRPLLPPAKILFVL